VLICVFICGSVAFAEEKEIVPGEQTGKFISSEWRLFNRTIDSFFSNQKYLIKENKSTIFISSAIYKSEGSKIASDFDLQMRFDLPRTTKKLKLVIEKEQNEIKKALTDENVARNKNNRTTSKYTTAYENRYTAGADFLLPKLKVFSSMIKFGIRLDMPINPFLKLNMQKDISTSFVEIDLSQSFLLYRQAGVQEISQIAFNKKWNETFHIEQINSLVWTDEKDIFELRHSLTLYQHIGDEKGLSYAIGANAKLSPTYYYDGYDASVSYRQLLYGGWLYGTYTLGADFPKADHFKNDKFVQFRLEAFFR